MANLAKKADDMSSDEEEEEEDDESESEEEEQPIAVKGKVDAKVQGSHPQEEEEESSEEEEDSDIENDAKRYNTVRAEETTAAVAKAANATNPGGKRGRDVEGKDEEPASKKSKENKGDKGRSPVKAATPSRTNKSEPSSKGGKAQVSKSKPDKKKAAYAEREESTKASTANKKRKASPPPGNGSTRQKADVHDKNSSLKAKGPFTWTSNLELALATMLWNDKKKGRPSPPNTKNDPYWGKLVKELSSEGVVVTDVQVSEKVRRMKNKWKTFKDKEVDTPWKNPHEHKLFGIWDNIWGTGLESREQLARPGISQTHPHEEEEEEVSAEEEEETTPAVRASKMGAQMSRKEESSESEEEEEETAEAAPKKGATSHDANGKEATTIAPTSVVSPFVSKPRLEFTPIPQRDEKKKATRKGEDGSIAEHSGAEASGEEDGDGRTSTEVVELLNSLKKESFAILHEVRASCLDALDDIRKQTAPVLDDMKDINSRLGVNIPTSGLWKMTGGSVPSLDRGLLEDFITSSMMYGANGANSPLAAELKSHWRQLRAEEMDLLEKRIQLVLKQLQLARKEFEEQ